MDVHLHPSWSPLSEPKHWRKSGGVSATNIFRLLIFYLRLVLCIFLHQSYLYYSCCIFTLFEKSINIIVTLYKKRLALFNDYKRGLGWVRWVRLFIIIITTTTTLLLIYYYFNYYIIIFFYCNCVMWYMMMMDWFDILKKKLLYKRGRHHRWRRQFSQPKLKIFSANNMIIIWSRGIVTFAPSHPSHSH